MVTPVPSPRASKSNPNQFNHIKTQNLDLWMEEKIQDQCLGEMISTVKDLITQTDEKIRQRSFNRA